MTIQSGSALYTQGFGVMYENVQIPFVALGAPSSSNVNFPIGKRWVCPSGEYCLTSFDSSSGILLANWTLLSGSVFKIDSASTTANMSSSPSQVVVNDSAVLASSIIIYSANVLDGAHAGAWGIVNQGVGTFTITSTGAGDTTNFFYIVVNS